MADTTADEREAFYDAEIAPALLQLCDKCQERGLSMIAMVEWDPGEIGRTARILPNSGVGIRIANTAIKANGNVDALMIALIRYGHEHGHGSVILENLGVPPTLLAKERP